MSLILNYYTINHTMNENIFYNGLRPLLVVCYLHFYALLIRGSSYCGFESALQLAVLSKVFFSEKIRNY